MRASQKLQERCDWVRILNHLDVQIARVRTPEGSPTLDDLYAERDAAIGELVKLGYVVP